MGLGCLIGLHDRWSGWERVDDGFDFGLRHPYWVRHCLSCGEFDRRQRPPADLCGRSDDDHNWQGSTLFPLKRALTTQGGEVVAQTYKRCRDCPAEKVFFSGGPWGGDD